MRYKCLAIDHDDTAVSSSLQLHYPAYLKIIKEMRPNTELLGFEGFMDKSFSPGYLEYLRDELDFSQEELQIEFDMWRELVKDKTPDFFPGFAEFIKEYQSMGGIVAVISHSSEEVIRNNYASEGIVPDAVFGYSWKAEENKPNPYPLFKVMEQFGLEAGDILTVDDLALGQEMAQRAGVDFACAGWSHYGIKKIIEYMKSVSSVYFAAVDDFRKYIMEEDEKMDVKEILSKCDHTLLKQQSTWEQIKAICDDGIKYGTASVCIPPSFVKRAREYAGDKLAICTVIGFPNGYSTSAVKEFETKDALANGADEIDMVINIGDVKDGNYGAVLEEIKLLKAACGEKILKVIIETCLLTEDEKVKMCETVAKAGADYIKTSTGFSTGGATREDVALMRANCPASVKVKAAGGIASLKDAEDFIELGADRLGTSRVVKCVKETE